MIESSSPGKQGLRIKLGKWQYWVFGFSLAFTIAMSVAIIVFWEYIERLGAYGYLGVFIISIFGGATIIAPVPMTPVVFVLGRVLTPWLVGLAAGLGDTLGGVAIYLTGHGGGTAFLKSKGKARQVYDRLVIWMKKRGTLTLFVLSATLNPFYYPASLAAGALRFGAAKYTIISLIGKTIKNMTVAFAGYWGLRGIARFLGIEI